LPNLPSSSRRATCARGKKPQISTIDPAKILINWGREQLGRDLLNPRFAVAAAKGQVADATSFDNRRRSESARPALNLIETEQASGDDLSAILWLDWSRLPLATTRPDRGSSRHDRGPGRPTGPDLKNPVAAA
jgi:hypothetical protein